MCLSIPGKIIKINKQGYLVKYPESQVWIANSLLRKVKIGDWVLVQQKYITEKLTQKQAADINKLYD